MCCKYQRFEVDHVWSQSGPVLLLTLPANHKFPICVILIDPVLPVSVGSASAFMFRQESIDKIRTYRTQTPYTFFGHKAFTAISYPGEGAKSQPTG
jgi:hypothetical protein